MRAKNTIGMVMISLAVVGLAGWRGVVSEGPGSTMRAATMQQELPEGVTRAMVEEGKEIYNGAGLCASCHRPNGEGVPNLGNNIKDNEWLHIDGSYASIIQNIMDGVTAEESSSGTAMPSKGGSDISDEQVRAVAAYVWTLRS